MNDTFTLKQNNKREPLTLQPQITPIASIIWLHGLGASADDLVPVAKTLKLADNIAVRHIFPHAPMRPVTLNQGFVMPAWYDITGPELTHREDETGILASEKMLVELIDAEITKGMHPSQIYLAGFSQGGAQALFTGLRYQHRLGGIIALSCYLPLATKYFTTITHKNLPIFMAAGTFDPIVQLNWSAMTRQHLLEQGCTTVAWHVYPMEHSISLEEIVDITAWFKKNLDKQTCD